MFLIPSIGKKHWHQIKPWLIGLLIIVYLGIQKKNEGVSNRIINN